MCGKHMGHTNCMMFNMVAPLEMTLHDGVHPLVGEQVGPRTGAPDGLATWDDFLGAYKTQLASLVDHAARANDILGKTHQALHPTPYLSALVQGPMESGKDLVHGGARFNSSGVAMVGLADVVDSLAAVKTLVYERKRVSMRRMLEAVERDFAGDEVLLAEIRAKVPKFGTGEPLPAAIASELIDFVFELWQRRTNYRGGRYVPGYWSMSNHVAFGLLSGALPSGRRRGKAFTPGITPSPLAEASLLDNIRQIASIDPRKLPNNIAFNVKLAPGGGDTHAQMLDRMVAYTRTYFDLGGMQLQFNVVSTETLRDAMQHPEAYRGLLVRISGYNAYFVELNRDMQLELIERAEHR
jgi:formate C-acetyltransferase